jgi:hypothetical protein
MKFKALTGRVFGRLTDEGKNDVQIRTSFLIKIPPVQREVAVCF